MCVFVCVFMQMHPSITYALYIGVWKQEQFLKKIEKKVMRIKKKNIII